MGLPKRILMATDFSDCSDRAAEDAIEFAHEAGATLEWTHAVDVSLEGTPLYGSVPMPPPVDRARKLGALELEGWWKRAIERGLSSSGGCVEGSPAGAVVARACEVEADLVIVGSHGHTGLGRALLGSVAERIVRDAPCSVLVVRGDRHLLDGETIVLGDDLSPSAAGARSVATSLAGALDVLLHVVHAIDLGIPYLSTLEVAVPNDLLADAYADARSRLESLARESSHVRVENQVVSERAPGALCDAASKLSATLVVVGSHGRRGAERLLLGSVAERVVRHAPCSVLVAR